jgi:oligoendopeptidase F
MSNGSPADRKPQGVRRQVSLPAWAVTALNSGWRCFEQQYQELRSETIGKKTLRQWLRRWTEIHSKVQEIYSRLHVAASQDTSNIAAAKRYLDYLEQVYLPSQKEEHALKEKLVNAGLQTAAQKLLGERPYQNVQMEMRIFREENLPLLAEEERLVTDFNRIIGSQTVEWEGREVTIAQLLPVQQDTEREKREKAWLLSAERQFTDRDLLNDLWLKLVDVRRKLAVNAGLNGYRSYRWRQMLRFDYTPDDCYLYHEAIRQEVVPAAKAILEKRRKRLGLRALRPWDLAADTLGRNPLRPFNDAQLLETSISRVFRSLDIDIGENFDFLRREQLLDLDNRKYKAPGGFATFFEHSKHPFIFMNAVGLHNDLETLLHEAGHTFHFIATSLLPYHQQWQVGLEFSEVASMAMEYLAMPFLSRENGGFYHNDDFTRSLVDHLEKTILFWPFMAVVDSFQHWFYDNPSDPEYCDCKWLELWSRFMVGVDWSDLDDFKKTGWHRKQHIFQVPFYYVEYGLAQLGALQLWANSLRSQATALTRYKSALALGCAPLPVLYGTAGVEFGLSPSRLRRAVNLIMRTISELDTGRWQPDR